jgi:hypothetical protein
MVANYRCNEIKEEALQIVEEKLQKLFHESSLQEITDFKAIVVGILSVAVAHYT